MQFNNYSPFPGIAWEFVTSESDYFITAVARAKFKFVPIYDGLNWGLIPDSDQGELFDADVYYGEVGQSAVRYESDYVGYKPNTDIILNAHAHAPKMKRGKSWKTSVEIYSHNHEFLKKYSLVVRGEKKYRRFGLLWLSLGRKKEVSIPIRYERARGGTISKSYKNKYKSPKVLYVNPENPIGCGIKKIGNPIKTVYAPQIFYADKKHSAPAGFGFINRAWKTRVSKAGTYNEQWLEHQHPLPPKDFDDSYNQAAHPELIMDGYLRGGANFHLDNLTPNNLIRSFTLPDYSFISRTNTHTGEIYKEMNIDTVIIDLEGENSDNFRAYISYRSRTPKTQAVTSVDVLFSDMSKKVKHGN